LLAAAAGTICDTLMVPSLGEASAHYGLIAEAVSHPPNFASTSFRLRAGALAAIASRRKSRNAALNSRSFGVSECRLEPLPGTRKGLEL
jgi:hypothetical protein